jgi:DsbC/DsbD-like thiol-disulfide interchange protein
MKAARVFAFLLALAPVGALLAGTLGAQSPPRSVSWSMALDPPGEVAAARGGRLTVAVTARIAEGWHVYGTDDLKDGPRPLAITLPAGQPFTAAGKLRAPEPDRDFDASFNQVTTFYARTTTFRLPVAVAKGAPRGEASIAVAVAFQACDGRICLPGRTVKLSAPVQIR